MPTRIDGMSDWGRFVLHDAGTAPPSLEDDNRALLEGEAAAGRVFFFATDDPSRFRVDVYVGEEPPPELQRGFEPLGGSFLLEVPSGRLKVAGLGPGGDKAIEVARGPHLLSAMTRRAFDGKRHQAEMIGLLGEADWRFASRADRLSLLGCLPILVALGGLLAAIRRGRWVAFLSYAVPLLLLAWVPHLLLRWSARYRRIQRAMGEHEAAKPLFVLTLVPTERVPGLSGGFLNV